MNAFIRPGQARLPAGISSKHSSNCYSSALDAYRASPIHHDDPKQAPDPGGGVLQLHAAPPAASGPRTSSSPRPSPPSARPGSTRCTPTPARPPTAAPGPARAASSPRTPGWASAQPAATLSLPRSRLGPASWLVPLFLSSKACFCARVRTNLRFGGFRETNG